MHFKKKRTLPFLLERYTDDFLYVCFCIIFKPQINIFVLVDPNKNLHRFQTSCKHLCASRSNEKSIIFKPQINIFVLVDPRKSLLFSDLRQTSLCGYFQRKICIDFKPSVCILQLVDPSKKI